MSIVKASERCPVCLSSTEGAQCFPTGHTGTWLVPSMGPKSLQGGLGVEYKAFSGESMCQQQQHLEAPASSQHTPLGAQGLYIQTLLPGSPAASDGRLSLGDRILEVNGSSLRGVSYMRYAPPVA